MEDPKFAAVMSMVRRAMRNLGFDIFDENWRPNVWSALALTAVVVYPFCTINSMVRNMHRMSYEELTDLISLLITGVSALIELLEFIFNRHDWRTVMKDIGERRLKYKSPKVAALFDLYFERNLLFSKVLTMMYITPAITLFLVPLVFPDPIKYNLPLHCILPWLKPTDAHFYAVNFIYQCIVVAVIQQTLITGCLSKVTGITSACCQINALKLLLHDFNEQINDGTATPEAIRESLGEIIQLYALTKEYIALMQQKFAPVYLLMYATCGGIVCMCLTVIADDIFTTATPLLLAAVFSVLVHCFFGNQLLIDNDSLPETVYTVDWYKLPLREQKAFRFLLANVQPDVSVHGVLMPLNMGTFVSIMKAAFSYYSILSKKHGK